MRFFDPTDELLITHRKLPHWSQDGAVVFITWRTLDSMPKDVIERWRADRNRWLMPHDIDPTQKDWKSRVQKLPQDQMLKFHELFTTRWHDELDACHGACVLGHSEIAGIVQSSLLHFNGDRYEMFRFVIMPNHIHLLAAFPNKEAMLAQCDSWKHFTGREINRRLALQGRFWQQDAFDHLVRHEHQFRRLCDYIAQNPAKARLRPDQARVWASVQ
ncbi:MAG: transposase [Prosthecobacter sp.]|uniref:transposase n=1 Tax=Prosthecobacter sp. TaxID=1965333 RepID=UPI00262F59CE|nr:transposase [Prosthecobacter sp.]MCF7790032.1 transposase [Prosthecobacter sp.]